MLHTVLWFLLLSLCLFSHLLSYFSVHLPHHHLAPCHFSSFLSSSHPHPRLFLLFSLLFSYLSPLIHPASLSPQVDSMDNFTPSNTPSREDDPKSHLKSRSRSPSMASDMEPIEVRQSLSLDKKLTCFCIQAGILPARSGLLNHFWLPG